jgi:Flp pilus assembly pilin Flp
MLKRIKNFKKDEDGAVTVDWVVLTAAVVALAGTAIVSIQGSTGSVGSSVGSFLANTKVE